MDIWPTWESKEFIAWIRRRIIFMKDEIIERDMIDCSTRIDEIFVITSCEEKYWLCLWSTASIWSIDDRVPCCTRILEDERSSIGFSTLESDIVSREIWSTLDTIERLPCSRRSETISGIWSRGSVYIVVSIVRIGRRDRGRDEMHEKKSKTSDGSDSLSERDMRHRER
jgi:hypothetical protein